MEGMEPVDIFWLLAFTIQLLLTNMTNRLMSRSLRSKPLASQSSYDQALLDSFQCNNAYICWICLVVIATRFQEVRPLIEECPWCVTSVCSVTTFGRSAVCITSTLACLIRILYLYDMNFVEETLGERRVRAITFIITVIASATIVIVLLNRGEVVSGLIVLYTGENREVIGPFKNLVHAGLYIMVIISLVLMQLYTECIKYQMRRMAIGQTNDGFKGIIRKTGIFTIFAVSVITLLLVVNILFPNKSKNQNYFLSQDLISCFTGSVIVPQIIAGTNPTMKEFVQMKQRIIDSLKNGLENLRSLGSNIHRLRLQRQNQIHPNV